MPTWMQGSAVVIMRTFNGWAVGPSLEAKASECVSFETWDAAIYYLAANFATAKPTDVKVRA